MGNRLGVVPWRGRRPWLLRWQPKASRTVRPRPR